MHVLVYQENTVWIGLFNISGSGSDKQSITCLISLIENPSIPTPSLFDKLAITVCISLAVQGTAKNKSDLELA